MQFAAQVCPHIFEQLQKEQIISETQLSIIKVEISLFVKSIVHHWFCHQCVNQYHLPTE